MKVTTRSGRRYLSLEVCATSRAGVRSAWNPSIGSPMLRLPAMFRTVAAASVFAVGAPVYLPVGAQRLLGYAHHTKWTEADGLPYAAFDRVMRTPDGYLWLAGEGPLVRFDGVRYTTFDGTNIPALASTFTGGMRPRIDRPRRGNVDRPSRWRARAVPRWTFSRRRPCACTRTIRECSPPRMARDASGRWCRRTGDCRSSTAIR